MEFKMKTLEMLKVLEENPTFKGLNDKGHTVELRGEEKKIIHKKIRTAKKRHLALDDKWRIVKPIDYEVANELFRRGRSVECKYDDGTKRHYRKMPINGHVIIESDLPNVKNCLWYCLSYVDEEVAGAEIMN